MSEAKKISTKTKVLGGLFAFSAFGIFLPNKEPAPAAGAKVEQAAPATAQEEVIAPENLSKWSVHRQKDEFEDSEWLFVMLGSENSAMFDFPYNGLNYQHVLFRKKNNKLEALLIVDKGQYICGYDGCNVSVKVGSNKPETFSATRSSSGSSDKIFFDNPKRLAALLKNATEFSIRSEFYNEGRAVFNFKPADKLPL